MSHANAALTPRARLRLARLVVDHHWPIARAAERYDVSWPTAKRWADRYRQLGPDGMGDRSSRPHHCPHRTPQPVVRTIVHLRWKQRLGPVQIADRTGLAPSTVHAVLVRCRLNRLTAIDRVTGEPVRRYEHGHPGSLVHVDVKKLGNVPDGGGWRFTGRAQGLQNRIATAHRTSQRSRRHDPHIGTAFIHTVLDDHSRLAYSEIHADETRETAVLVLRHAVAWFAARGVTIERVMTDNARNYTPSTVFKKALVDLGIGHRRTRLYRPQTNGKAERFNRTLLEEFAYKTLFTSNDQRLQALAPWLDSYNGARPHTAIGGLTPLQRLRQQR